MTRRRRLLSPALWVAIPLVVLIGVAAFLTFRQTHQQAVAAERISNLEATVTALANALKSEQTATKNAGGQPVTAPADQIASTASTVGPAGEKGDKGDRGVPGIPGPVGSPGPAGPPPSPDQVRNAVDAYLIAHPPEGGKPPTDGQVAAAVAMYCSSGACRGSDGATGAAGPAGQSITGPQGATGPAGPGPADDQVAGAVAAFCAAHAGCVGATGATGPAGPAVGSFSFTFGLTEYDCSDPDANGAYSCTGTTPPP